MKLGKGQTIGKGSRSGSGSTKKNSSSSKQNVNDLIGNNLTYFAMDSNKLKQLRNNLAEYKEQQKETQNAQKEYKKVSSDLLNFNAEKNEEAKLNYLNEKDKEAKLKKEIIMKYGINPDDEDLSKYGNFDEKKSNKKPKIKDTKVKADLDIFTRDPNGIDALMDQLEKQQKRTNHTLQSYQNQLSDLNNFNNTEKIEKAKQKYLKEKAKENDLKKRISKDFGVTFVESDSNLTKSNSTQNSQELGDNENQTDLASFTKAPIDENSYESLTTAYLEQKDKTKESYEIYSDLAHTKRNYNQIKVDKSYQRYLKEQEKENELLKKLEELN